MSHTNSTNFLNLPLFVGTDKPAWLTDFNSAMQAIDNNASGQKTQLDDMQTAVTAIQTALNNLHPVGSIYISVAATNPGTLFGGVWQRIQDTFLLAAGVGYPAGSTGGEPQHILTVDEMPAHKHSLGYGANTTGGTVEIPVVSATRTSAETTSVGGGQPHNNMPPYLAVYVWQRTA